MEEEFGHSMVVTKFAKSIAWVCVALLNVFFIGFAVLRSVDRDKNWQYGFMIACIIRTYYLLLFIA